MQHKIVRLYYEGDTKVFKKPIIQAYRIGRGIYKDIIKELNRRGIKIATLKEYNKKIIEYCNYKGITVEDELEYIPTFFEEEISKIFKESGALNIGVIFEKKDKKIAEKTILKVCKCSRFLSIPNYSKCEYISDKVMRENGLSINIENTIEEITKKCDIIIDINKVELIQ